MTTIIEILAQTVLIFSLFHILTIKTVKFDRNVGGFNLSIISII